MKVKINVQQKIANSYLLFAGNKYYPEGGWEDFKGSFSSAEEAMKYYDPDVEDEFAVHPWAHVVNPYGVIVWHYDGDKEEWKPGPCGGDEE